jgi:glycerol-3-phosphate acyltransferase PlsY
MTLWLPTLLLAYLLGSIPVGYLVFRIARKQDIRTLGSGNIGATNIARSGARGLGLLVLALDALKGFTAVFLADQIAHHWLATHPGQPAHLAGQHTHVAVAAAVVAVLANIYPVWLGFKGGKGIATALGVFLALVPLVALTSLAMFILVVALTRYVSLGSILAAASIPIFTVWIYHPHPAFLLAGESIISIVTILKHHANIGRLLHGTESRFGSKAKASA